MNLTHTVDIARPPDDVFRLLADPENDVRWQSAVRAVHKLTTGPVAAGSRYRHSVTLLGNALELDVEILETVPPSRLAYRITSGAIVVETRVTLAPTPSGTRVATEIMGTERGAARFAAMALARLRQDQSARDLAALKALLETPPA